MTDNPVPVPHRRSRRIGTGKSTLLRLGTPINDPGSLVSIRIETSIDKNTEQIYRMQAFTHDQIRAMKGIDLTPEELEKLLRNPDPPRTKVWFPGGSEKPSKPKKKRPKGPNGENATELAYATRFLETALLGMRVTGFTFTGTRRKDFGLSIGKKFKYTPDYTVMLMDFSTVYVEVKGAYYQRAECSKLWKAERMRLELAAEQHRNVFLLAIKRATQWDVTRVAGAGDDIKIGRDVLASLGVLR